MAKFAFLFLLEVQPMQRLWRGDAPRVQISIHRGGLTKLLQDAANVTALSLLHTQLIYQTDGDLSEVQTPQNLSRPPVTVTA